eukprot:gnl/MRDRNA2_/MRDRNA2_239402_c0_seq1.p1 gnl/MRDRNA2_/MRDRNA2_239402_c0~~gnl/MRDRNA2_/MRDRNA2_239402_c0_seq1.p1  ORF type:complete len:442 (+),score=67.91 gnl/MRDRNA2_/MRDRNA2_239402_c0_seq1:124-1326(+)
MGDISGQDNVESSGQDSIHYPANQPADQDKDHLSIAFSDRMLKVCCSCSQQLDDSTLGKGPLRIPRSQHPSSLPAHLLRRKASGFTYPVLKYPVRRSTLPVRETAWQYQVLCSLMSDGQHETAEQQKKSKSGQNGESPGWLADDRGDEANFDADVENDDSLTDVTNLPMQGNKFTRINCKNVRQHVNPLSRKYQQPANLPDTWLQDNFISPSLPVVIDIGCAKGTWALNYAANHTHVNVLGLEIRRPMVELALYRRQCLGLNNVFFMASNANVDLSRILNDLKVRQVAIQMVTIQFPDPHFKKRNHKRRVVNDDFVSTIAAGVSEGTSIFFQSDVEEVQHSMVEIFNASQFFKPGTGYDLKNLETNPRPYEMETEREIATLNKGLPVYRMLFQRNDVPFT